MNIVALLVVVLVPLPLAYWTSRLLRRKGQPGDVSDAIGSGVIFVVAIVGAGIEYVDVLRDAINCDALGVPCGTRLSPFTRLAIFGGIAFVQVCTLYVINGLAEERERERGVWRAP